MTVLIAGGGVGGLTLALSLHQVGQPCRIFEAVADPRPLGVGINLQPHAVKELDRLDLLPDLDAIGLRARHVAYFSSHGHEIWRETRGEAAGYRWPQLSVHRGHLQMLLLREVKKRLGENAIMTGTRLMGWQDHDTAITIQLTSGERVEGEVLIAADGIHSQSRAKLFPGEGPPVWNGILMRRGTTWAKGFLGGRAMAMIGHKTRKFVCYPIAERGEDVLVNWIADLAADLGQPLDRADWNKPGHAEDLLPHFGDWRFDWLDVPALIERAEGIFEWPMVDRDPLPRWTHGRMTLLGDAAHAMYPIGSNGASQAILDARVLAREIRDHGPTEQALTAYEAERRPATTEIVLANRGDGPDKVLDIVEARAPDGFETLDSVISQQELQDIAAGYKSTVGMDRDRLNASPPIL